MVRVSAYQGGACIYTYICVYLSLSLSLCLYTYTYVYIYIYEVAFRTTRNNPYGTERLEVTTVKGKPTLQLGDIYTYIHIYIHRERERERYIYQFIHVSIHWLLEALRLQDSTCRQFSGLGILIADYGWLSKLWSLFGSPY